MAKIIKLSDKMDVFLSAEEFLEDTTAKLRDIDIEGIIIAAKCTDGTVITGYYKRDFSERQELVGHIQCDIIDQMIIANMDRYGGG